MFTMPQEALVKCAATIFQTLRQRTEAAGEPFDVRIGRMVTETMLVEQVGLPADAVAMAVADLA
jgi:hypothetical protein